MKFVHQKGNGTLIDIHVVPNAKNSEIVGMHGDALKVRIAAPPVDGAANEEVCRFFAGLFGVRLAQVAVVRGATSKRKTVAVEGVAAAEIQRLLGKAKEL